MQKAIKARGYRKTNQTTAIVVSDRILEISYSYWTNSLRCRSIWLRLLMMNERASKPESIFVLLVYLIWEVECVRSGLVDDTDDQATGVTAQLDDLAKSSQKLISSRSGSKQFFSQSISLGRIISCWYRSFKNKHLLSLTCVLADYIYSL